MRKRSRIPPQPAAYVSPQQKHSSSKWFISYDENSKGSKRVLWVGCKRDRLYVCSPLLFPSTRLHKAVHLSLKTKRWSSFMCGGSPHTLKKKKHVIFYWERWRRQRIIWCCCFYNLEIPWALLLAYFSSCCCDRLHTTRQKP